jgi:hypothetical protein
MPFEAKTPATAPGVAPPVDGIHGATRVVVHAHEPPGSMAEAAAALVPPAVGVHAVSAPPVSLHSAVTFAPPQPAEEEDGSEELTVVAMDEQFFQTALSELTVAREPDDVVDALVLGMSPLCREVAVVSVKGDHFKPRARADAEGNAEHFTAPDLHASTSPWLTRARDEGQYLGPAEPEEPSLFRWSAREVSATCITVAGRSALLLCTSGFINAFEVTRRSDHLARAASDALSRILRSRKH